MKPTSPPPLKDFLDMIAPAAVKFNTDSYILGGAYAKPRLLQKNDTKEIVAFYALTEECASVFPVRADGFLNLSELKIAEGFIQFVLYSEQRAMDGLFPYERFVEQVRGFGAQPFDGDHILIPPLTKAQLEALAGKLR